MDDLEDRRQRRQDQIDRIDTVDRDYAIRVAEHFGSPPYASPPPGYEFPLRRPRRWPWVLLWTVVFSSITVSLSLYGLSQIPYINTEIQIAKQRMCIGYVLLYQRPRLPKYCQEQDLDALLAPHQPAERPDGKPR